jgi:transcriptional regulator with XRE-family HTH domain
MQIKSVHDLAATARGRRIALGLSQAALADRIGVRQRSRGWTTLSSGTRRSGCERPALRARGRVAGIEGAR